MVLSSAQRCSDDAGPVFTASLLRYKPNFLPSILFHKSSGHFVNCNGSEAIEVAKITEARDPENAIVELHCAGLFPKNGPATEAS